MGTQQLLMIVLVAIVVAVAVSLAVVYFKSHQQETDINEVINEMNHIAATAQGWYRKPVTMAGGAGSFTGFTLRTISEPDSNDLAKFQVVSANNGLLQLQAIGYQNFTVSVDVYADSIGAYTVVR
jgi:hypothetical protein